MRLLLNGELLMSLRTVGQIKGCVLVQAGLTSRNSLSASEDSRAITTSSARIAGSATPRRRAIIEVLYPAGSGCSRSAFTGALY